MELVLEQKQSGYNDYVLNSCTGWSNVCFSHVMFALRDW